MVIGFTSVVGDLLHAGHALMLDECKRHCDYLFVGLIADPTKDRPYKNKPVQSLYERYTQLVCHRAVDEIIPMALKSLPISIRFVGDDYKGKEFTGKQICKDRGIEIYYTNRSHGLSSTELRRRVRQDDSNPQICCSNTLIPEVGKAADS